jgi:hydrogenase/urease accessory protein HupE
MIIVRIVKALLLSLLLIPAPPRHDEQVSASEVLVLEREVTWTVDVSRACLEEKIKFPKPRLDLNEEELQSIKDPIARYLRGGLSLEINGKPVEPEIGALKPEYFVFPFSPIQEQYIARMKLEFRFTSTEPIRTIKLGVRFFQDRTKEHRAVVEVAWPPIVYAPFTLSGPSEIVLPPPSAAVGFWRTVWDFVRWGMHHIFIGYDHIAFLLALLLAARKLMEMVKIATSFTVAHSLTLLLSALDVIRIKPQITESLIAASIVYVALENFWLREARYRWVLTFMFGLVHGLGFSSVLKERLAASSGILVPVVSFNLGVELGQIAILLVAFPLASWIRRGRDEVSTERRHRRLLVSGSTIILILGAVWLFERLTEHKVISQWLE